MAAAIAGLVLGCGESKDTARVQPISHNELAEIESDLKGWSEGRWQSLSVSPKSSGTHLAIEIEVSPEANSVALEAYCRVVREVVEHRLVAGQTWRTSLNVRGRSVRTCP